MWSDKDRRKARTVGDYSLRDLLAQAESADARQELSALQLQNGLKPPAAAPIDATDTRGRLRPAPARDDVDRDVPLLPPKSISYVATGALVSVAALALAHVLTPKKPHAAAKLVPKVRVSSQPQAAPEIGAGPLVSTLASLSKTVLAGYTQLPPPAASDAADLAPPTTPNGISDVIRVRASNVITGNGGLDASWPIEVLTPGIGLPNAKIQIDGLPAAARLNHGWLRTDGRWILTLAELTGLTVTVPAAFARAAVTVSLTNENDLQIAQAEAIIEPVPQPEAATAPAAQPPALTTEDKFNAFLEKWKRYKGRSHLTQAEKAALFVEYRAIIEAPEPKGR